MIPGFQLPESFSKERCPRTGVSVYSSSEWTDIPLTPGYKVTFHRIESHILSAYPAGMITYKGTQELFKAYSSFLSVSGLDQGPYVEISDYSGITNLPSKKARVEVGDQLLERIRFQQLTGHFVYNVPRYIKWLYNIGTRLKSPGIPMTAMETYEEALDHALALQSRRLLSGNWMNRMKKKILKKKKSPGQADELLDYIGRINWDEEGIRDQIIPVSHPLKPVFNAIAVLKADYDKTHRESQKIQEEYKGLFNHIADPILVFDQESNQIMDCNNAFLRVYGYSREELTQMTPLDLHPSHELKRVSENIDNKQQTGANRYTNITKNKQFIEVEVRTHEADYQGRPAWISTIRDITKQNRLEQELRRHRDALESQIWKRTRDLEEEIAERRLTETKFKTLFESNADAVLLMDRNHFIDCNQAAISLFGMDSKEDFINIGPDKVSARFQENGQPSKPEARKKLEEAFIKGTNRFEWIHKNVKTGRSFPADVLLTHMVLNGKDVLQAVVRDITDRRTAEQALRQSEENYRGMIQNMQDVFYRTDLKQNLTMISPSGLRLLGYDHEKEILGKPIGGLFFQNSPAFKRFMGLMTQEGQVRNFELTLFTRHQKRIPVLTSSKYFTDALDGPIGIEGTITSIREQKEAEEALRLAKIQAESAARTKSEFLANMSHEIRTPMNAILGMGELIIETQMDDYQKNLVATMNNEAASLLSIINSILDFSKAEAGRLELEKTRFNLRKLFEDVVSSFAISAHQKGLEFISYLPVEVIETVEGDPGRLRQVLVNLIGNAIKFTTRGEVFIWVEMLNKEPHKVQLRFNVRDTGIGIPEAKQEYIFESFAQADGSTTRKFGGTGLGTTISKQLVEMMGGEIGLESAPGRGTTFWFTINLTQSPCTVEVEPNPSLNLRDKSVLVAAANQNARYVFSSILKSWGARPIEAASAQGTISLVREAPDLVLLDLQLPDMDSQNTMRQIREQPNGEALPIILIAPIGNLKPDKNYQDLDIQGYLLKPVKEKAFKEAITEALKPVPEKTAPPTMHADSPIAENKKIQILLAEDYPANQQVAVRHLLSQGYQVSLAKDGQQALDLFKAKSFDLVLMDIQMPVMDGYEATRQIRQYEKRAAQGDNPEKRTPVIAMTAHAIKGYKEKCLTRDMDGFMTKPLKKASFLKMISDHIHPVPAWTHEPEPIRPEPRSAGPSFSPIDMETALGEFDGDREFLFDVLEQFLETMANQMSQMDKAADEGALDLLKQHAHAIKGGAANLTALDLYKAAANIENLSSSGEQDSLRTALDHLLFEYARLKAFVREL